MTGFPIYPVADMERLRIMADHHRVSDVAKCVFDLPEFPIWSACVGGKHHYGKGGLLRHTAEVVALCSINQAFLAQRGHPINDKVLFLAALFHDVGKIWDYEPVPETEYKEWRGTAHKRNIHHISRSGIVWTKAVAETGQCKEIEDEVLHCILSHHGLREWGSPVFPKSREAWILHLCDGLSARADDCDKVDLVHSV
jgi:3'-5' exoribonuclease